MLTYEALIEEARKRNMPATTTRGILREYLQILILKEIYKTKAGRESLFTGGTWLRIVHNLKRFSEDLDFESNNVTSLSFEKLLDQVSKGLKQTGFNTIIKFKYWDNVFSSSLIFPEVENIYGIKSKYSKSQGLIIKVETFKPNYKLKSEAQVVSGFGEFFTCLSLNSGIIFANKIDTFIKKDRGRHLYDLMFMLSNKFPVDMKILKYLGIKAPVKEAILNKMHSISKKELRKMANNLRPFLFDESEA